MLEGLWVSWGMNEVNEDLLKKLLNAKNSVLERQPVRVLRYMGHTIENNVDLLANAANDPEGRVRLEATVAASWLDKADGLSITQEASKYELDRWMVHAHSTSEAHLIGELQRSTSEFL